MKQKNTNKEGSKTNLGCVILFLLPFFIVGVWSLYVSLNGLYLQSKVINWIPVESVINNVEFVRTPTRRGETFETKCNYNYKIQGKTYANNNISIGYRKNNTENHRKLYDILIYANKVTAYVNPNNYNESTLTRGSNSSTISLLIFSLLWNGFIVVLFKNKNKIVIGIFILFFIISLGIIISGVLHTDFEKKLDIIDKKETESGVFQESINRYEKLCLTRAIINAENCKSRNDC